MTRFTVDLDELQHVVDRLDSFGRSLASRLVELQDAVDALQHDWQGEAAEAKAVVHAKLAAGAADLHAALIHLHAVASNAHASYTSAVRANQQTWQQVR